MLSKEQKNQKSPGETQAGSIVEKNQLAENAPKKKLRKVLGNYSYNEEHLIGWGYTSKVYKGKSNSQPLLNVAIKKISITDLDDLHCDLLRNETKIVKKLKHPNVVNCFDVLFTKKNCYIVMEFCEAGCLEKYMTSINGAEEKIKIIQDICQGFRYLVGIGIVHRDIKPGNILKTSEGIWKIADFGFAADINKAITDNNISVGTPLYMAPQSLRSRRYSYQSDIFGLGIVIYQVICGGKLLWTGKNKKIILQAIMSFDFSTIELQSPFDTLFLKKMLQIKPQNRPQIQKIKAENFIVKQYLGPESRSKKNKQESFVQYQNILDNEQLLRMGGLLCNIIESTTLTDLGQNGNNLQAMSLLQLYYLTLVLDKVKDQIVTAAYYSKKYLKKVEKYKSILKPNMQVIDPKTKQFCENTLALTEKVLQDLPNQNKTVESFYSETPKISQNLSPKYSNSNFYKNSKMGNIFSFTPKAHSSKLIFEEYETLKQSLLAYQIIMERIFNVHLNHHIPIKRIVSEGTIPSSIRGIF